MTDQTQATETKQPQLTVASLNESNPQGPNGEWSELAVRFRKTKDKDGNEVPAREPISLFIPVLTAAGVAEMLAKRNEDGSLSKEAQLVVDAVTSIIHDRTKEVVSDLLAEDKEVTATTFPLEEVTFEKIANLPPAERKGRGISDEVWTAFAESYSKYYIGQGLDQKKVETATAIFRKRLQPAKSNKPLLDKLRTYLSGWFIGVNGAEDASLSEVYSFLDDKIGEFLNVKPEDALDLI